MGSVTNDRQIDQSPASAAGAADLSGFGDVSMVTGGGAGGSDPSRASMEPDLFMGAGEFAPVDESRSSEDASRDMVSRSSKGEVISSSMAAVDQSSAGGGQEIRVFEGNRAIRDWMHGFQLGDLVWGKVKSHPCWPGYIYPEAFADPSVRRSKRQGHVLVAFFGDSSYGWFEPAELIPFDQNYIEKSRQTTIRNFAKAVEDAADETSRREALGLTCYCRNPINFRPTGVPGHLSVDVPGFERGSIYSLEQINRARDRFVPEKTLIFAKEAALDKSTAIFPGLDRIKGVAVLLALRRARYEEFDETYAQAFGMEPVRPSPVTGAMLDQPERFAPRAAPLSGPQVYAAEPQLPRKTSKPSSSSSSSSTTKGAAKTATAAKKNKYVLKRRDDLRGDDTRTVDATAAAVTAPSGLPMLSLPDLHSSTIPNINLSSQTEIASPSSSPPTTPVHHGDSSYLLQKRPPSSSITAPQNPPGYDGAAAIVNAAFNSIDVQNNPNTMTMISWGQETSARIGGNEMTLGMPPAANVTGVPKKTKKMKRKLEEGTDGSANTEEIAKKKKKKQKMVSIAEIGAYEQQLSLATAPAAIAEASFPAIRVPWVDISSLNLGFPLLVNDLKELALDPFYGMEDNVPVIVMNVFLRFRSLVYQKSLVLSSAGSEGDAAQELQARSQSAIRPQLEHKTVSIAPAKALPEQRMVQQTLKPKKSIIKSEDPTKSGRKRTPSERQEELSAKRTKKLGKLKSISTDRKTAGPHKPSEGQKEISTAPAAAASAPPQPAKPKAAELARNVKTKQDQPPPPAAAAAAARTIPSPTCLFMKFPLRATLPSVMSLKAKFARFGPLEHNAIRVYWKSFTCKVVFKYKADALAALEHGKNNDMFGQVKVTYSIKDVDSPATDVPFDHTQQRPPTFEAPHFRPGTGDGLLGPGGAFGRPPASQLPRLPTSQLKSILKKPGDEAGSNGNSSGREPPRVKFMLDSGGQLPEAMATSNNSRGNGDGSRRPALSYSTEMLDDRRLPPPPAFTSNSYASYPPPSVPIPPPPTLTPEARNAGHARLNDPRIQQQIQQAGAEGKGKEVTGEVSGRVMSLLLKCNDIIGNLKSTLGYVPLHPL